MIVAIVGAPIISVESIIEVAKVAIVLKHNAHAVMQLGLTTPHAFSPYSKILSLYAHSA